MAVVGGRIISRQRLEERVAEMRRGPLARQLPPPDRTGPSDFQRLVARQLVTEEILLQEARAAGIDPERPEKRDSGKDSTRRLMHIAPLLLDRVTAGVSIDAAAARAYYERNVDRYRVPAACRVRQIVLADEATALDVLALLRRGIDFERVARERSIDPWSRPAGGDLGYVKRGELAGPVEEALFRAPLGTIVGPIQSRHGWHVARVDSRVPEHTRPFEEVFDSIVAELLVAERERVFGEWLEERRAALSVMAADFAHPADPASGMPAHRH